MYDFIDDHAQLVILAKKLLLRHNAVCLERGFQAGHDCLYS